MKSTSKTILVPTDFTAVAGYALQHAVRVSTVIKEPVTLLHLVDSKDKLPEAKQIIDNLAEETLNRYLIRPSVVVKEGSIFTDIAIIAQEVDASMIIMGSHSIKGKVSINDSWALQVITSSPVPFITIQEPPVNKRYDDVVFPVDYTSENKEKHKWITHFCNYYLSKFHLIKPHTTDPELMAKIDLNMASAQRYLDEKGAKYEVYTVKGEKGFAEEVLDISVNIRADLIVIMTTKKGSDSSFIVEPQEQFIISNASHIPVMSINPR